MGRAARESGDGLLRSARRVCDLLRVGAPGGAEPVDLSRIDPRATPGLPSRVRRAASGKEWSPVAVRQLGAVLAEHQERLFARANAAGDRRRVLLVLQAMDCGGKDGTIKRVAGTMNPLGLRITAFGAPTARERARGFLWRIRRALPPPGFVGIFNRSHYEDVLVARVRQLVPGPTWEARYDEINEFERELAEDGLTMVKVMLHISAEEQRRRLLDRLADPTKVWKFNPGDLDDRGRWADYQRAYGDALTRCSDAAPWYVVPADRKWYRNWAVANLVLAAFAQLRLEYPVPSFDIEEQRARLARVEVAR